MIVSVSNEFLKSLTSQVRFIYKDKPKAALKFRKDLLKNIKKDLKNPFHFKSLGILKMKIYEIMFLKDMFVFTRLMLTKK